MNARLRLSVTFMFALALAAPAVLASEGEGGDPVMSPAGFLFRWINSLIILGGIGWGFSKLRSAFRERAAGISTAINQAAVAKQEAERRVREAEQKLAKIDEEVAGLRAEAQRDAAAEAAKIAALARDEVEKVERAAATEILAAERAARMELKALAARLAVERAEALIRGQLTPQVQSSLVSRFVEQLGGGAN